jgi:hypothetical protein
MPVHLGADNLQKRSPEAIFHQPAGLQADDAWQVKRNMAEKNKVVVHFLDGRVIKGTTFDFFPNRPTFHLDPLEGGSPMKIACKSLKALFFVRDFEGRPQRQRIRGFLSREPDNSQGRKVAVLFKDGELICGYTLSISADREGFVLFPADEGGNNTRVYVMKSATAEVKVGPAADALTQKVLDTQRKAG